MVDWCCGMKAVCIHDGDWVLAASQAPYSGPAPALNSVSTLSAAYMADGAVYLRFYEYPGRDGVQPGFRADLFLPCATERPTSSCSAGWWT